MIGYEYGNARLRARHAGRLRRADYVRLLDAGGLDQMLGSLTASAYADAVEAAVARYRGLRRLDEAVSSHLTRQTNEVSSFYDETIRARLDLVRRRWDVRNVTALIRSQGSPGGSADLVARLVPAGRLGRSELGQLAGQPSVRAMVDLLAVWKLPDPETSRHLRASMSGSDPVSSALRLEAALFQLYVDQVDEVRAGEPHDALTRALHAEMTGAVMLGALRVRAARMESGLRSDDVDVASCSSLPLALLRRIIETDEPVAVVELLTGTSLPAFVEGALAPWVADGDLVELSERLTAAVTSLALRGMLQDPLGIGVPVGYLWEKEQEARNLRLIGRAHVHGLDHSDVADRLVIV